MAYGQNASSCDHLILVTTVLTKNVKKKIKKKNGFKPCFVVLDN